MCQELPPQKTLKKELVVSNRSGIHARVSTLIALNCKEFTSEVFLRKGSTVADCRSVLELLSLGAGNGTTVYLEVTGEDAEAVVDMITTLFKNRFNEDEDSLPR